ncbi:hypothetical protein Tco_1368842 [Tanacetum coccineum]
MSQPANDVFYPNIFSDDEASFHEDASDNGNSEWKFLRREFQLEQMGVIRVHLLNQYHLLLQKFMPRLKMKEDKNHLTYGHSQGTSEKISWNGRCKRNLGSHKD